MGHISDNLLTTYRENYHNRWGEYMPYSDTSLFITNAYHNGDGVITSIEVLLESLLTVLHIDDFVYGYRQCSGKTLGCYLITNISEPYVDNTTPIPQVALNLFTDKKGCFTHG